DQIFNRTIKPWTQSDGSPVPVQGQDWWYNRQHHMVQCSAILNIFAQDPEAARMELNALDAVERLQRSNSKGCLLEENGEECIVTIENQQTAIDMEFTSVHCLVNAYFLHLFGGAGAAPVSQADFDARLYG